MRRLVLAFSLLATAAAAQPVAVGKWSYSETADPITDAKRGVAVLRSETGVLAVKCDENGPGSIYVSVTPEKPYLGPRPGTWKLKMRLDDAPATEESWSYDRVGATILPQRFTDELDAKYPAAAAALGPKLKVNELVSSLATAKKMVFRLVDYQAGSVDVVLLSDGDATAVRRASSACGDAWPAG